MGRETKREHRLRKEKWLNIKQVGSKKREKKNRVEWWLCRSIQHTHTVNKSNTKRGRFVSRFTVLLHSKLSCFKALMAVLWAGWLADAFVSQLLLLSVSASSLTTVQHDM